MGVMTLTYELGGWGDTNIQSITAANAKGVQCNLLFWIFPLDTSVHRGENPIGKGPIVKEFYTIKLSGLSIWSTKKKLGIYVAVLSQQFLQVLQKQK